MKNKHRIIVGLALLSTSQLSFSQTINWRSLDTNTRHLVNLNVGADYGFTVGLGYGYRLKTWFPSVVGLEYSSPLGSQALDDFKTKIGVQSEVFHRGNLSATLRVKGVFRQYTSPMVRMVSVGSELSSVFGYYKPRWHVAAEVGFDKAIATKIKHSDTMHENYPAIRDGWFVPTGGNFSYGMQAGFSARKLDVYLKAGKVITQDFRTTPLFPFYSELGCTVRL